MTLYTADNPLFTITLNPAIDKTLVLDTLQPGGVHRSTVERIEIGGKGINVSLGLVLHAMPSTAFAVIGHRERQQFILELSRHGITPQLFPHSGITRTNLTLIETGAGGTRRETKINEAGPQVSEDIGDLLVDFVAQSLTAGTRIVICGSLPPGINPAFYGHAILRWRQRSHAVNTFVDAAGEPLRSAIEARPCVVKVNSAEAGEWCGRPLVTDGDHIAAARAMLERGVRCAIITRGRDGLMMAGQASDQVFFARVPQVTPVSTVGAGDAAMVGLLYGLEQAEPFAEIARRMAACGTAAVLSSGSATGTREAAEALFPHITVETCPLR
jgi:1-phosphofructokinase family hexose kinase